MSKRNITEVMRINWKKLRQEYKTKYFSGEK